MRQEEKQRASREKILAHAAEEFGAKGYGQGSVNAVCAAGGIAKGLLYHYFRDKDELYLACVKQTFEELTESMRAAVRGPYKDTEEALGAYFEARLAWFEAHPRQHRIFCECVMAPPAELAGMIRVVRAGFDEFNEDVLKKILEGAALRSGVTPESAASTFRLFQDFANARLLTAVSCAEDAPAEHERLCRDIVSTLLYGVLKRGAGDERQTVVCR